MKTSIFCVHFRTFFLRIYLLVVGRVENPQIRNCGHREKGARHQDPDERDDENHGQRAANAEATNREQGLFREAFQLYALQTADKQGRHGEDEQGHPGHDGPLGEQGLGDAVIFVCEAKGEENDTEEHQH